MSAVTGEVLKQLGKEAAERRERRIPDFMCWDVTIALKDPEEKLVETVKLPTFDEDTETQMLTSTDVVEWMLSIPEMVILPLDNKNGEDGLDVIPRNRLLWLAVQRVASACTNK